ncbi:MAG: hypothetical protein IVW57_00555 [Ktedonobacterales bacterium]|nr:hypothetical protein [Ktedonobacterales bacterium]
MSQELLSPTASPPPSAASSMTSTAVAPSARPAYVPEPPPPPSRVARAIKWPIRKLLKGLYLLTAAARSHRAVSVVLLVIILGLLGSGVVVYRATHPSGDVAGLGPTATGGLYGGTTPFTVVNAAAPPLPASMIQWMHGHKYFDAQEVWNTFSAREQQALTQKKITASTLQDNFNTLKSQGFQFTEFIYSGGYRAPDGTSHYTIEVLYARGNQAGLQTYYFLLDADGKIAAYVNLTPS